MQRTNGHSATPAKATLRAIALARLASNATATEAERAIATERLTAHCVKHGLALATIIAEAAKPEAQPRATLSTAQQAARDAAAASIKAKAEAPKPEPEAPKAEAPKAAKPSKPTNAGKADVRDAERERAIANRAHVAKHYNGASLASHAARAPKLADAIERVTNPVQRAKTASTRDESGIMLAAKHANATGDFCPLAATIDLGILSRLASLNMLKPSPVAGKIRITKAGRDLAANIARKAA